MGGRTIELVGADDPVTGERVDPVWEGEEADRRREVFANGRHNRLEDRRAERDRRSYGERLDHAYRALGLGVGGMRSRPVQASRGGGQGSPEPKPADPHREAEIQGRLSLIAHHVHYLESLLDSDDGLLREEPPGAQGMYGHPGQIGGYSSTRMMTTRDRDRIVWDDFQGVRSEIVAREAPYLGSSARTIERSRRSEAARRGLRCRPVDGTVLGPAT